MRERGAVDLATAIRTMTSMPATVFGLKDRGQIRPGAFADLLIFDLAQVNDAATYQEPHQLAEGFTDILVNGKWARRDNSSRRPSPAGSCLPTAANKSRHDHTFTQITIVRDQDRTAQLDISRSIASSPHHESTRFASPLLPSR